MSLFDVSATLASLGYHHGDPPFLGHWGQIHWMNTPGPMYCAETDNATPAPLVAPNHVEEDKGGFQNARQLKMELQLWKICVNSL